jgi:uncharacterized coiled-coil protein SlyX
MTDESYMTEADLIYEEIHKLEAEITEKDTVIAEKDTALAEKVAALEKQAAENARLRTLLKQNNISYTTTPVEE